MIPYHTIVLSFALGFVCCLLIKNVYERFNEKQETDPVVERVRQKLLILDPKAKDLKIYKGDRSYTINKEKMFLCVKDDKGDYYDDNMLVYVGTHELAHAINDEIGHGEKFQRIFKELLDRAEGKGLYDPHKPIVQNYCGT